MFGTKHYGLCLASFFLSVILIFGFLNLSLNAQEARKHEKEKKYFSSTSLSGVMTTGNNKTFSFSVDTDHNFLFGRNELNLKGSVIYSGQNSGKKSQIYYSHLKYDLEVGPRAYLLGLVRAERNILAGYNFRCGFSLGAGYFWVKKEKIEVHSEGALGWSGERSSEKVLPGDTGDGGSVIERTISTSFLSSILATKMTITFSSSAQFTHDEIIFVKMSDLKAYRLNSYSSISASMSRNLALKTSLKIVYENKPVPGYKNMDLYLLTSFVVKF
jgi:putative salt-induced outer membrane protein YdiY